MRSALLVCLAACGFDHGAVQTAIDAPATGDASVDVPALPGDMDGDSVADETDNCPAKANSNQRDHDADGHGDACDHCPGLPSVTDPDGDGDGVGDDCDPRPTLAGDAVVLFEGFYDAASITNWTGVGSWAVAGGRLVQGSKTVDYAHYTPPIAGGLARHAVMTSVRLDDIGVSNSGYDPGVAVAGGVDAGHGYYCAVRKSNGLIMGAYGFWMDVDVVVMANDPRTWTGTFVVGTEVTLFGRIVDTQNICTASESSVSITADDNHGPTNGPIELVTTRAGASFDYIFVVSVGS